MNSQPRWTAAASASIATSTTVSPHTQCADYLGMLDVLGHNHGAAVPGYRSTVTEARNVRGEPKCANREPVFVPVRLLGPIVDQ